MRYAVPLVIAAALVPQIAGAVWMPMCGPALDPAELRFFGVPDGAWIGYDVYGPAPGFAMYRGYIDGGSAGLDAIILEHCESRTRLVATLDPTGLTYDAHAARTDAVWDGITQRAFAATTQSYTFDDLAAVARALGADAKVAATEYASCACATQEALRW